MGNSSVSARTDFLKSLHLRWNILPSTALRTDGLCTPCKTGYLESIEERKRQNREQRERMLTESAPQGSGIADGTHSPFPEGLRWPLTSPKAVFCGQALGGDVYNGGFHQYFFNDAGSHYSYAEESLIALCAFQTLEPRR